MRRLRRLSNREANREHRWDVLGHVPSGWAHVQHQTVMDKTIKFFYQKWQHLERQGARTAARRGGALLGRRSSGHEKRLSRRELGARRGSMSDAELWAAWRLWIVVATVVVLLAAAFSSPSR